MGRKRSFLRGEPGAVAILDFSLSTFNHSYVGIYLRESEHGAWLWDASGFPFGGLASHPLIGWLGDFFVLAAM